MYYVDIAASQLDPDENDRQRGQMAQQADMLGLPVFHMTIYISLVASGATDDI